MQEASYHKDNLKVLGRLFKDYREQSGFSVRGISRSINISHAVISEIENCKIHPNLETLKELYGTIGIELCTDADFLDQQSARIQELYDTLYYMEYEKARLLLEKLRKNDERLRHSPLRIDYLLADKLGSVMLDRESADVDFHVLSEEVDHMSREQHLIYRLGHGVKLFYALDYKTAVEWFEMNLGSNKDKLSVLNTYYLSHAYHKVFRNYLSIRYADETADALNRHNNIKRRLEIDILKAQKHIDNGAYDSAKNLLLSLENALRIQYNDETARKGSVCSRHISPMRNMTIRLFCVTSKRPVSLARRNTSSSSSLTTSSETTNRPVKPSKAWSPTSRKNLKTNMCF